MNEIENAYNYGLDPNKLYTIPEVLSKLRISVSTLREWRDQEYEPLRCFVNGKIVRICGYDLIRFLNMHLGRR